MSRSVPAAALLAVVLVLGGCTAPSTVGRQTTSPPTTDATAPGSLPDQSAVPHQFVVVEPVQNESVVSRAPANESVRFGRLSETRRETFLKAVDGGRVAAVGWEFTNQSRPTYVRYNGTWYTVLVGIH